MHQLWLFEQARTNPRKIRKELERADRVSLSLYRELVRLSNKTGGILLHTEADWFDWPKPPK